MYQLPTTFMLTSPPILVEILLYLLLFRRFKIITIVLTLICFFWYGFTYDARTRIEQKAIVHYGSFSFLTNTNTNNNPVVNIQETTIIKPRVKLGTHVIIQVKAVSMNPVDKLKTIFVNIPIIRWFTPQVAFMDFAGNIVQSGCANMFRVGDDVYGQAAEFGAFAQFITVECNRVGKIPSGLSYEDAAALPTVLLPGWYAMHKKKTLTVKSSVLIIGASGGCGSFGVRLAKKLSVQKITCVASNVDDAINSGCDVVLNYRDEENFMKQVKQLNDTFDLIYDTASDVSTGLDYYPLFYPTLKKDSNTSVVRALYVGASGMGMDWIRKLLLIGLPDVVTKQIGLGKLLQEKPKFDLVAFRMKKEDYDDVGKILGKDLIPKMKIIKGRFDGGFDLDVFREEWKKLHYGKHVHGKIVWGIES
jgi:threonine dehydrogenase-like Zn-dependent dehydrogenase